MKQADNYNNSRSAAIGSGGEDMGIFLFIGFVIILLAVLNIDGKMKKQLENEKLIIEKLDALIHTQTNRDKMDDGNGI
ncbi:hypothetical protein [Paenibacillus sp. BK720]|nr:hypothetical protein [Paenibacillus sp. BK720]